MAWPKPTRVAAVEDGVRRPGSRRRTICAVDGGDS